jgi:hypothetical protein
MEIADGADDGHDDVIRFSLPLRLTANGAEIYWFGD